jgi:enediyne biosynthesis protein E5
MHTIATIYSPPSSPHPAPIKALRRFAVAITFLNVLGHSVLGFEQSWLQPIVALGTTYTLELLLETIGAALQRRRPRFLGPLKAWIDFLLPAHISGLAVAMLLYANENCAVIAFAAAVAIGSKAVFRAPIATGTRHFFNPSNLGITTTLLLFPWVGVAPPYEFTEQVPRNLTWLLPVAIVCTGSLLNYKLTKRHPLILGWLGGFVVQAFLRSFHQDPRLDDTTFLAAIAPMTGVAFVLFTFYMITDPATTPAQPREQVIFGASVAAVYGLIVAGRGVFAMFFALTVICGARGAVLYLTALACARQRAEASRNLRKASAITSSQSELL